MAWVFIIATAGADVISSVFIKEWTIHGTLIDLVIGVCMLAVSGVSFAFAMKYFGLVIANVLWNSLSTVLLAGIAIFFFHEKLTSVQLAGILITIVGVALVGK
jgi:spermidine export protein MdtJ